MSIGMVSLTRFAGIARQYSVPFSVEFTERASYACVGGSHREWKGSDFYAALTLAGAMPVPASMTGHPQHDSRHDIWFQLESLS